MEYLLKKISTAMSQEWDGKLLEDLMLQDAALREEGVSVWSFLEHMGAGRLLKVTSSEAFALGLDEVFLEMYHSVLKRVRTASTRSSLWSPFLGSPLTPSGPLRPGIHVEKGARAAQLDRALVRVEALHHGLLRERVIERQARRTPAGQELCRGGGRRTSVTQLTRPALSAL